MNFYEATALILWHEERMSQLAYPTSIRLELRTALRKFIAKFLRSGV